MTAVPDPRAVRAVAANEAWCQAVCRAHGIPSSVADGLWRAGGRPPPFYPDVITLRPGLETSAVAAAVPRRAGASVKDSFGDVELGTEGFELMFSAQWIWREPAGSAARNGRSVEWAVVADEAGLARWSEASGQVGTFPPAILGEPGVRFLTASTQGAPVGRAALGLAVGVVGLSNVWAGAEDVWRSLPPAVGELFPGRPLAGYEQGADLVSAVEAGFAGVGPLRVWMRSV